MTKTTIVKKKISPNEVEITTTIVNKEIVRISSLQNAKIELETKNIEKKAVLDSKVSAIDAKITELSNLN